jgi:hypothetical protein
MTVADPKILNLVKIKSWYIPGDASTYQVFKKLGIPLLKIHADFLPTVALKMKPAGYRAKAQNFNELRDDFLDRLGTQWKSKAGRNCKLADNQLAFTAEASAANRKAIARVETIIHEFCGRWGFRCVPQFSELPNKLKLVVNLKFDPNLEPVIPNEDTVKDTVHELILGFTKIKLTLMPATKQIKTQRTLLEIFTKAGTEWVSLHTSTFTDYEIGDVTQFMHGIGLLFSRRKIKESEAA